MLQIAQLFRDYRCWLNRREASFDVNRVYLAVVVLVKELEHKVCLLFWFAFDQVVELI
jgi:hypothetical protein